MINGLRGNFRSLRHGGIIGSCRPNPYGIVGSFESESIVTNCDAGDAIDDIDIISRISLPGISVEFRTIGVLGLANLDRWVTVPQKKHQTQSNQLKCWRSSLKMKL